MKTMTKVMTMTKKFGAGLAKHLRWMFSLFLAGLFCNPALALPDPHSVQAVEEAKAKTANPARAAGAKTDTASRDSSANAPAEIRADAQLLEYAGDLQLIRNEKARIRAASGTVEIPVSLAALEEREQTKLGHIRAWMLLHKVPDDWTWDAARQAFMPPTQKKPAAEAGPATAPEGK